MMRGRFAPSPSGPLHMGSLITALASFFDIKKAGGSWHLRIDDIDPPRAMPEAERLIIGSLKAHGLNPEGPIQYQSAHEAYYRQALETLSERLFYCRCSRKSLRNLQVYPGTCRDMQSPRGDSAIRLNVSGLGQFSANDPVAGLLVWTIEESPGDFIVQRRDGLWAYNLTTAVDDGRDFDRVLRGQDLLDTTPQQLAVMHLLGLQAPSYCHIPVLCFEDGSKLSKQSQAPAINDLEAPNNLRLALTYLGLEPPHKEQTVANWLAWGLEAWDLQRVPAKLAPFSSYV